MLNIFLFELRYRFSRPATYIYFSLFLLVALILVASGNTAASEKVYQNAPNNIAELQLLLTLFGVFIASAIMGVPLHRDIEHKTGTFLFSYPITKAQYFMGRFWGSFVTLLFISLGVIIGIYLGTIIGAGTGWTPADRYGPNLLIYYVQPWLTLVLPNLWFSGTLFFALVIFTRSVKSIYSGAIIVFIGYLLANFLAQDLDNKDLVQIIDPFGLNSFDYQNRYLTPYEQNNFLLDVSGNLLLNRLLWTGIGILLFVAAYFRFSFNFFFNTSSGKKKVEVESSVRTEDKPLPKGIATDFSGKYQWKSLKTLTKIEVRNILKDVYFRAILLGGLIFLVLDFWIGSTIYGVPRLPSTSFLLEYKGYDYLIFVFIILVFYTGEALHRDKASGYASISDTFPVYDNVLIASKFFGISFVGFILAIIPIFVGVIIQSLKGYFQYDMGKYLIDCLLLSFPDYLQMIMLVFAIHLIVNSKFAGHAAAVGVWLIMIVLRTFGNFNFNLFFFSYKPAYLWSDMNGLGHFGDPLLWFNLYWTFFGLFLILLFTVFFARGADNGFKNRLSQAKGRLTKTPALIGYASLLVTLAIGGFIYKNVVYTNTYLTGDESNKRSAEYEKQLKQYEFIPQPKLISVLVEADLHPYERDAYFKSKVVMVNKTDSPIDSVHLMDQGLTEFHLVYDSDTLDYRYPLKIDAPKFQIFGKKEEKEWYKIYKLPTTLEPGDTIEMSIHSSIVNTGFPNSGYGRELVYNGTFIGGGLPGIGYDRNFELTSDEDRREYDLPIIDYELPPHGDPYGVKTLLFSDDADFISFEAILSTTEDQVAIAPGYLQKEWTENGRRYFHYVQDSPIQSFFNFVSAEYEIVRDTTLLPDSTAVNMEIFYHKDHDYNLDRFMAAYRDGLEYFSNSFGSFQFRQMRLLEFPRYADFAQSFPNTVPYSEGFGWIADFSDPDDFDYGYFVTAHELAHQWWGHQVAPNFTRGSNLISEALAEYTALALTERKYGSDNMKTFLRRELDSYLSGRSGENKKENTFINCNRAYQWYRKGSLILYGLRDYIGEESMNTALKKFSDTYALKVDPPFAGSNDLYEYFKAETPDSLHYYLEDTWKKITLYENKVLSAEAKELENDQYEVTLTVTSQKVYADSLGQETNAEYIGDYMDIGVFAADDKDENGRTRTNPLILKKFKVAPGENTYTFVVDGSPVKAGIDPYNKLIDRIPDDNITDVDI